MDWDRICIQQLDAFGNLLIRHSLDARSFLTYLRFSSHPAPAAFLKATCHFPDHRYQILRINRFMKDGVIFQAWWPYLVTRFITCESSSTSFKSDTSIRVSLVDIELALKKLII